ncbi:MAG: aldo/keto reductase [Phycisphaerae bacterium]
MLRHKFGRTDLEVTPLGYGSAEIGIGDVDQQQAGKILNAVLDAGINVIDTAACYGDSEVKIGKAISSRRNEYVLVSKCGHNRENMDLSHEAWSPELITESVEKSLERLQTDRLDVVYLHSCDADKLDNQDMLDALVKCKEDGKVRFIGYSGDAAGAEKAVGMDVFDALETSVNFVDQQGLKRYLPTAHHRNLGVLAKRPIANGCWRGLDAFEGFYRDYVKTYVERLDKMALTPEKVGFDGSWAEMALRFTVHQEGVHTAIVGSTNPDHIRGNVQMVDRGPLPEPVVAEIEKLWDQHSDESWVGQV